MIVLATISAIALSEFADTMSIVSNDVWYTGSVFHPQINTDGMPALIKLFDSPKLPPGAS